jgi:chromosome partitioning protein
MRTIAVYNMKGGVGKTTTAVNLSYLAAAAGQRVLLWDLDPQAASSYAFRVRPRVEGFGRKTLESGRALGAAIKATDYDNLDLLPADFAYRKFDRLLDHLGKPGRVVTELVDTLGRDYDVVFLDCPAGFSLLTEGIFAAADAVLVPTIPTVLSLRTVARLIKWAERDDSPLALAAFFSMVDRRKTLHRRAVEWSSDHPEIFLAGQVPYASVVEQMGVRRLPLPVFAAHDPATMAFARIRVELQSRLAQRAGREPAPRRTWTARLEAVEALMARLESADEQARAAARPAPPAGIDDARSRRGRADIMGPPDAGLIHTFDTERGDLKRCGHVLQLRERKGNLIVVVAMAGDDHGADRGRRAQVQVDTSWALDILSGAMSPLGAFDRRLGRPGPRLVEDVRILVGGQTLHRVDSRVAEPVEVDATALRAG